ncbi:MAG: MFS transporter [Deltaproteobacteria bacterium]|nr:MFS transporter [Deltaproteobacteria bacterium]
MLRRPFFYGYVIVALCFFNLVLAGGFMASFGVFNIALLEAFQWSRATTAGIASVNGIAVIALAPLVGWTYDRLGPRVVMPLGGLLIGTGLMLAGGSTALWQFYLWYGLLAGLGLICLDFVGTTTLLSHWFRRNRATAIGFAAVGLGVGIVIVPGVQFLVTRYGWRAAMVLLGAVLLASQVPLNALLQRRRPEDIGQLPDGAWVEANTRDAVTRGTPPASGPPAAVQTRHDWTPATAVCSFPFWSMAVGHLAAGIAVSLMHTHTVAHMVHVGLDKLAAATVFGVAGLVRIPGTPFWGFVSDRLGRDRAYVIATVMALAGIGLLMFPDPEAPAWWFVGFAVLYGVGHSAANPTFGATLTDIFWGRHVATIIGLLEIFYGIGIAIGPWFGGLAFDVTGSYRYAWMLALLSYTLMYVSIQVSMMWKRRTRHETR